MGTTSSTLRRVKDGLRRSVLAPVGRTLGAPKVHLSSPLTRGGNYLFYWMWAYAHDTPRHPARVLYHDIIDEWLVEFPLVGHLSIKREDASTLWSDWVSSHEHTFGVSFQRAELDSFCRALVASSPNFQSRMERSRTWVEPETVVINVRRGDYYTYPHLTAAYGIDVEKNVTRAIQILGEHGRSAHDVLIVSDDVEWCLEHLGPILPGTVRVVPDRTSMFDDLAVLAAAHTLVVANSTFSFWGSYIGSALQSDHLAVAPDYHYRDEDGEKMRDPYDPRWIIAEA